MLTNKEVNTLKKAYSICLKYGDYYPADSIEDILQGKVDSIKPEKNDGFMLEDEADILGDAINICDKLGKYGTGDSILDAINKHLKEDF